MDDVTTRAIESIVKQFRGGERALSGKRAAELVYGGGKGQVNEDFMSRLTEAAPGIERYIAAPDAVTPPAEDQSGNPLATQPENDPQQGIASNVSTDEARAEQDEIDERLKQGREEAEEKADEGDAADEGNQSVGSTQMNPEASSADDKPEEREKAAAPAKKAGKKTPGA